MKFKEPAKNRKPSLSTNSGKSKLGIIALNPCNNEFLYTLTSTSFEHLYSKFCKKEKNPLI